MDAKKENENALIGLWIDNLMDRVRLEEHFKAKGYSCESISDTSPAFEFLQENTDATLIIDLQNASLDFTKMRQQLNAQTELLNRITCYFPHVRVELKKEMQQIGVEHIFPRSVFFEEPTSKLR